MRRSIDGRMTSRGTVLIDSESTMFLEIMRDMIADCGFTSASPAAAEPPWLSVMRTQPTLVICDCNRVSKKIRYLIVDVLGRRIPLLIAVAPAQHDAVARGLSLPDHVVCFDFPISRAAFRLMIAGLIPPAQPAIGRVAAFGVGLSVEAAVTTRSLDEVRHEELRPPFRVQGVIPDRPRGRWIKLLP